MTIQAPSGLYYFTEPTLAYCEIIKVTRNIRVHYLTNDDPTGDKPEVRYFPGEGKFLFSPDNPFNFADLDDSGARVIEYIVVIYKRGAFLVGEPPIID